MSICIEGKLRRPVIDWLASLAMTPVFEVYCHHGTCDIVGVQWGERIGKLIPEIRRMIAVELKMEDAARVLEQAKRNRNVIAESYAAMPRERIDRMRPKTYRGFLEAGVGLLSVNPNGSVHVVQIATSNILVLDQYRDVKRKLWRRRDEWKSRIDSTRY